MLGYLFQIRNFIAKIFKIKSSYINPTSLDNKFEIGSTAGMFKVFDKTEDTIVFGEDDKHLDVRVLIKLCPKSDKNKLVVITTLVNIHNTIGKIYFFFIKPVRSKIVPMMLKKKFKKFQSSIDNE